MASAARESTYAIYAADSGIECAASAVSGAEVSTTTPAAIDMPCFGSAERALSIPALSGPSGGSNINGLYAAYQSSVYVNLGDSRCAEITLTKGMSGSGGTGDSVVQIESRGYNFCLGGATPTGPDTSNPKIVERAIRLTLTGM